MANDTLNLERTNNSVGVEGMRVVERWKTVVGERVYYVTKLEKSRRHGNEGGWYVECYDGTSSCVPVRGMAGARKLLREMNAQACVAAATVWNSALLGGC